MTFKDHEIEIPLNELLRNFENNRVAWLSSRDVSNKERKMLSDSLDLVYLELQNQSLSGRNEVRNFVTTLEDTAANRRALGFLSGLLDSRPKQSKELPEEKSVPKYSNNHLKYDFASRGWANGNEIDLGNWEAKDYNNNSFSGITNRVTQMKDFLTSYRDNLKLDYDYSNSRYGNKETLIARLDKAIEVLNNTTTSDEAALDNIINVLGALGWSSGEINQLFRTSIQEPVVEAVDPLVSQQQEMQRQAQQLQLDEMQRKLSLEMALQQILELAGSWVKDTYITPYQDLQEDEVLRGKFIPETIHYFPINQESDSKWPGLVNWGEISKRLLEKLTNSDLSEDLDILDLFDYYEFVTNGKGIDLKHIKKVPNTDNEVYVDALVFDNRGVYYTYNTKTRQIFKRKISNNLNMLKDRLSTKQQELLTKNLLGMLKQGGVLKLELGRQIVTYDYNTPKTVNPQPTITPDAGDKTKGLDTTALILDLSSLVASLFPGYGNLIGGVSGMAGSITSFAADWKRDGIQWKDGLLLGANLGSDLVGLIPGAGVIGKLAKVRKYGKPILTLLSLANAEVSTYNIASKILDPNVKFKDITMDEWNLFAQAVVPLIISGKNKVAETKLENTLEHVPSGKTRQQALNDVINSKNTGAQQKQAAQRALWVDDSNVPNNKAKQRADNIWNPDGTLKNANNDVQIAEPTPLPVPEQPKPRNSSKKKKYKSIDEIPNKKEVKQLLKDGYNKEDIVEMFNVGRKQKGGKIAYLTTLREGGIIKADNGLKFQELEIPTQDNNVSTFVPLLNTLLSFNLKPYDYYLNNPGIKTFTNFEYKPKTPFAIKTSNLFNSELSYKFPVKSSKVGTLGTEYTPEIESTFKFKLPGIGAEITKALTTISFNNRLAKKAKEAIKPVYKSDVPVIALSVKGDYEILNSYNRGIQNLYNQVAAQTFNDPTLLKLTQLEAWSKQLDAGVLRDLAYAQSYKLSDAANLQTLQQAANQNYENDFYNDSVTASVAKAKSDIDSAKDYKNFTAGINSIDYLQKRNYDKANSYNQHILNAIQNLILDKMYKELAGVTNANELRMIYRKYLNMIQNKINEFYGIPTYDSFLFNYQIAKKGGKLDRNLQISKMLEKRYIELLKKDERKLDRLSKVTQKAILKSLGLK